MNQNLDYLDSVKFLKGLRVFLRQSLGSDFDVGRINQANLDFSLLPIKTDLLKERKLKFVLIFNHQCSQMEICLSGQNKSIRRECWQSFIDEGWDHYHLAESMDDCLAIVDEVILEIINLDNVEELSALVEIRALGFMTEVQNFLEPDKCNLS